MNRWRKWRLVAMVSFAAGWAVPARASILLYTQADTAGLTPTGKGGSQQLNSFGPLVTSTFGPVVDPGPGFLTTLAANSSAYSAIGGVMGVQASASATTDHSIELGSVEADAFAQVFDNVHPLSPSLTFGAMMGMQINFLVAGSFNADIEGPVSSTINSDLFYRMNGHVFDLKNFIGSPVPPGEFVDTIYTFDAGMVPNGGVIPDFEGFMQVNVRFDAGNSTFPVNANVAMLFLNTAKILSVTATYNGQPVPDFTLTGDSGAVFPTGSAAAVPEPGSLILVGTGLAAWLFWRRRSKEVAR